MELLRMQKLALWYTMATVFTVEGQISSVPRTETAYLNSQVRFTCTVEAPWILTWEVDGIAARFLSDRNVSFNTITTREVERSTLHIMASLVNNNSEIACISVSVSGQEIARAVAFLYIQGVLDPPGNISVVSKSYSTIHLQWTPPFSLQVNTTNGINNYNNNETHFVVSVMNKFDGKVFFDTANQCKYVYHRRDFVHCSGIVFKIAAVNPVGRGAFSEGFEATFEGPLIGVGPFNQTVTAGEWANFSCQLLCSHDQLITWFMNESPLPSLESSIGAKFHKHPDSDHGHCNNFSIPNETQHILSIQLGSTFDDPLRINCAVVSLCALNAENCTPTICFSDTAYLEVLQKTTKHTAESTFTSQIADEEITSTAFEMKSFRLPGPVAEKQPRHFNDTERKFNDTSTTMVLVIALLASVGSVLITIIISFITCKVHHQRGARAREEENHIYEIPTNACTTGTTVDFSSDCKVPSKSPSAAPPATGLPEMNPCPAYETLRPYK